METVVKWGNGLHLDLGNSIDSAVAVRQGALRLRDLHEDTTGQGLGGGGGGGGVEGISPNTELNVNSTGEHYLSTNHHLPAGVGHQREGVIQCPHEFGSTHCEEAGPL